MTLPELRVLFVVGLLVIAALVYAIMVSAVAVARGVGRLRQRRHPHHLDAERAADPSGTGRILAAAESSVHPCRAAGRP